MQSNGKPMAVLDKDAPWVEKYRPRTLDDVAAHKEIVDTSALWSAFPTHMHLMYLKVYFYFMHSAFKVCNISKHLFSMQSSGW